jgi:hypothetical protein
MPTSTFIDESLMQLLLADAGVVSLVGTRIYSTQAPQGAALPAVVFQRDTNSRASFQHMTGMTGLARASYTISALGTSLESTRNLTKAIRSALQYKRSGSVRLVVCKGDDDLVEPQGGGEQLPIYRTDMSVEITFNE